MNGRDSNETALLDAARRREPGAIERLLDSYRNYLGLLSRIWLRGSLQAKADPSDFVQDTLLKAQQHFAGFRGQTERELVAWLRQILARGLLDFARRYSTTWPPPRPRERSLDESLDATSRALGAMVATSGTSPSRALQRRELSVVLSDALSELPADRREVILLRNFEQLDWEQIARLTGRTPDAARMLWTRALRQLKPLIEGRL